MLEWMKLLNCYKKIRMVLLILNECTYYWMYIFSIFFNFHSCSWELEILEIWGKKQPQHRGKTCYFSFKMTTANTATVREGPLGSVLQRFRSAFVQRQPLHRLRRRLHWTWWLLSSHEAFRALPAFALRRRIKQHWTGSPYCCYCSALDLCSSICRWCVRERHERP